MKLSFSPQRRDDVLAVSKSGEVLTINGRTLDLSVIPEGALLPAGAVDCEWISGPIERRDGMLHLTLLLPHGPSPSQAVAFPEPITVTEDGPIALRDEEPAQ